ncbi:MAG: transglycosylase domain-containing protein [Bacteroidota bacterium]
MQKPWFKKITKAIWILFLCIALGVPIYVYTVSIDLFGLFGGMPSLKAIENPENDLSSELISADGVSLGRYFITNRSQVSYDQLSPDLVNTLLYSEDHRFYDHSGMDFWAYIRVFWGLITLDPAGGGSTITQQLAKNLFSTRGDELEGKIAKLGGPFRLLVSKTKEWIIAVKLEQNFTKEEIIAMYLNTASFGSNAFGIKVAAETYFNKGPDSLNVQESAVLVGMLQAVTRFNPVLNPDKSLAKRNQVLGKLFTHGYIKTREEFDSIKSLPIDLRYAVQNQNEGLATYFRSVIRNYLMAWCKEHGYDLWESGLRIHTTIDSRMQQFAEEAMAAHMAKLQKDFESEWQNRNPWVDENTGVELKNFLQRKIKKTDAYKILVAKYGEDSDSVKILLNQKKRMTIFSWKGEKDTLFSSMDSLKYYNKFLQSGLMSMDPNTGAIKAWVGGINHKYFKYDHVKQGTRQPGSTFKPFVYGKAIEDGYSPCLELLDIAPTLKVSGGHWTPKNSDGTLGTGEKMNIRQAMARSVNSITAQMIDRVKPQNVVDFAHRLGITSELVAVPSLCLGTSDVTLFDMVSAYCSFANLGIHIEPYYITRIEDKNGNVIENFVPKTRQAMDEQTAYKMIYMLKGGVTESGGTSGGISHFLKENNEVGGKTGTTDNASDGWYMGVTHNLVTGVWVGGDERSIHFPSWNFGQGGKTARPIWDKYMMKVYEHPETGYGKGFFKQPSRLDMTLDCSRYSAADSTGLEVEQEQWKLEDVNN